MKTYNPEYIKLFYTRHIADGTMRGDELHASCPSHDDQNPSFSANMTTGMYICFGGDCKLSSGGNMPQFLAAIEDISQSEATQRIDTEHDGLYPPVARTSKKIKTAPKFPITQDDVITMQEALFANEEKLQWLKTHCLWTEETMKQFEIGYNALENAYWIPIKQNIELVNVRKYKPQNSKMKWYQITGAKACLFPIDNSQDDPIYLMEGEKDCILANQLGLNAVTSTGGAGTFNKDWKEPFLGKNVVICYDVDQAGREGAGKVAATIGPVVKTLKIVELPIKDPPNADFTDYIKAGNTVQDFLQLVKKTKEENAVSQAVVDIDDLVTDSSLDTVAERLMFYKRVRSNVRVIGVESSPYVIPREVCVTCNRDNGNMCSTCSVSDTGGNRKLIINETTPRILDLIECSAKDKSAIIKDIFGIPARCRSFQLKERDHQAINRVSAIPAIDEITYDDETQNQTYAERELYFLGERLEANNDYEVESIPLPSPKDQALVHLGYKVKPADSSIDEFVMTPELKNQLGIFQCA